MRRFKLTNGVGQTFDLMRKDAFFHAPDGLGFDRSAASILSGNAWIVTEDDLSQPSPSGNMVFAGYDQYSEFCAFIRRTPIKFWYAPKDEWYGAPCTIISLGKSEIQNADNRLTCPVTFLLHSRYQISRLIAIEPESGGKVYSYEYPYTYGSPFGGRFVIQNNSEEEAPLKITIFGPVLNPKWSVTTRGESVQDGRLIASIPMGSKVVIDSNDSSMEISEYTNENIYVRDLYGASDFSTDRLVKALPGQNIISFEQEGASKINASIEVTYYADSV